MKRVKSKFNTRAHVPKQVRNKRRVNLRNRYNKAAGRKKNGQRKRNLRRLSHWQLMRRLDRYAVAAKTPSQEKTILDIKEGYDKEQSLKKEKRSVRNRYFQLGREAGLHPQAGYDELHKQDLVRDQKTRDAVLKKARAYYNKHYGLRREFDSNSDRKIHKLKSRDRYRDIDR